MAMLLLHHLSVGIVLTLLLLFFFALPDVTILSYALFVLLLALFVGNGLLLVETLSQTLSLATDTLIMVQFMEFLVVFFLLFDDALSFFHLSLFAFLSSLLLSALLLFGLTASLFLLAEGLALCLTIGFCALPHHIVGVGNKLLLSADLVFVGFAGLVFFLALHFFLVSSHVI